MKVSSVVDDLFQDVSNNSGVNIAEVIDRVLPYSHGITEKQLRLVLYLKNLGENQFLHGGENPYLDLCNEIISSRTYFTDTDFIIDMIDNLIPKPAKPLIFVDKNGMKDDK